MSLDFSHCDATWSFGGFHRFRERLMVEITGEYDESLQEFLNHPDDSGALSPEDCRKIAPKLREAVSCWELDDYDRVMAEELANGMDRAANEGVDLLFNV
jgi:hypothetical protein